MQTAVDVLLHPVRWKVVQHLAAGPLTTRQLHERMPEVPQATLYRQIQPLLEADLVRVAEENAVRGAIERTYVLGRELGADDLDADGYRRASAFLLAALQADVEAYLDSAPTDPARDGLSLTRTQLHVTDDELTDFRQALLALVEPLLVPGAGRRPVALGMVMAPGQQ